MTKNLPGHGITEMTPQTLLLNAGAYYKNLTYDKSANEWKHDGVLGATSGGGTVSIRPEYFHAEVDGATVAVKGLTHKVAEAVTAKFNMTEYRAGVVQNALHLELDTSTPITGYKVYKPKANIVDDDYLDNIAFVGTLVNDTQVIIILDNALCTSALESTAQNKTQAKFELTYECHANLAQADLTYLPYRIYFPDESEVLPG